MLPVSVVVIVFVLAKLLFSRLEAQHREKYLELGSPSFHGVKNKGFAPIVATIQFIVRREHRTLNDSYISNVSDAMLVCFVVYIVLFAYAVFYANVHNLWRGSGRAA